MRRELIVKHLGKVKVAMVNPSLPLRPCRNILCDQRQHSAWLASSATSRLASAVTAIEFGGRMSIVLGDPIGGAEVTSKTRCQFGFSLRLSAERAVFQCAASAVLSARSRRLHVVSILARCCGGIRRIHVDNVHRSDINAKVVHLTQEPVMGTRCRVDSDDACASSSPHLRGDRSASSERTPQLSLSA
jgi:hypothetical protein